MTTNEKKIINAIEDNLFEYIRIFAKNGNNTFHEDERILRYISDVGIPSMQSNSIYKNQFQHSNDPEKELKEILSSFKIRHLPCFLTLGPSSEPDDLRMHLKNNGLSCVQKQKGMAVDLSSVEQIEAPRKEIKIRKVKTHEDLRTFLGIYIIGFNYSRTLANYIYESYKDIWLNDQILGSHYIAFWNEVAVATSSLFVTGKIAGVYNVSTIPQARNRGIGKMMTVIPLIEAKKFECDLGILHATDAGAKVYEKVGFEEFCSFELYMKLYGSSVVTFPLSYAQSRITNWIKQRFISL